MSKEIEDRMKQIADLERTVSDLTAKAAGVPLANQTPSPSRPKTVDEAISELEITLATLKRVRGY